MRMALDWDDDEGSTQVRDIPEPVVTNLMPSGPPQITIIGMPVVAVDDVVLNRDPAPLRRPLPPPRRPKRQMKTQVMAAVTREPAAPNEPAAPREPAEPTHDLDWSEDEDRTDLRALHPGHPEWDSEPKPVLPDVEPSTHRVEVDLHPDDEPIPHTIAGPPPFSDRAPQTLRGGVGVERHPEPDDEPAMTKVSSQIPEEPFDLRATEVHERTDVADEPSDASDVASEPSVSQQPAASFDPRATDVLPTPHIDPNDSSPAIEIAVVMAGEAPDSIPVSFAEMDDEPSWEAPPEPVKDPTQDPVSEVVKAEEPAPPTPQQPLAAGARKSTLPSVPPMALDTEKPARPRDSRWNKVAGVSSVLALAALAATLVIMLMPRTGSLQVELGSAGASIPKAEVFVDGQKKCDTHPCLMTGLEPGMRTIKVLLPGAADAVVQTSEVVAGETRSVKVSLPTLPAQGVRASSAQRGVHLWIDGTDRGALPLTVGDLTLGSHKLRFEADARFEPVTRMVDVHAGRMVDLGQVSLPIKQVRLSIDLQTAGARVVLVEVGGASQEIEGPWPRSVDVSPGRYKLVASKAGFRAYAERLTIDTTKADRSFTIDLSRRGANAKDGSADDAAHEPSEATKYGEGFDPYAD